MQREKWMDVPRNDCLFIRYKTDPKGKRVWSIHCECGNNKLLLVGDYAIRCHSCGRYHARDAFMKLTLQLRKTMLHDIATAGVERIEQEARRPRFGQMLDATKKTFQETPEHIRRLLARRLPIVKSTPTGTAIPKGDRFIPIIGSELLKT